MDILEAAECETSIEFQQQNINECNRTASKWLVYGDATMDGRQLSRAERSEPSNKCYLNLFEVDREKMETGKNLRT